MAAKTRHTQDQQLAILAQAQKHGRAKAAEKAGVNPGTISSWAKAHGVELTFRSNGKPAKKTAPKRAKSNGANGHANGHTNGYTPPVIHTEPAGAIPPAPGDLAHVQHQLEEALASVKAMRQAFRQVFG